jgi:hypothetical protein
VIILEYCIALVIYVLALLLALFLLKWINKSKVINILLPIIIFTLYCTCITGLFFECGFYSWNFNNALPTGNVSPFTYCLCFLTLFVPKKIRKYLYTLISFLSLGMCIAGLHGLVSNVINQRSFWWIYCLDLFTHGIIAWFGIYLYKTGQDFTKKINQTKSALIIVGVALVMLVLNLHFGTAYFGLSLRGNHSIYGMVLCKSSILSALIYFIGLLVVLYFGGLFQKLLSKKIYKI